MDGQLIGMLEDAVLTIEPLSEDQTSPISTQRNVKWNQLAIVALGMLTFCIYLWSQSKDQLNRKELILARTGSSVCHKSGDLDPSTGKISCLEILIHSKGLVVPIRPQITP